jgi:hypothetical protein
MERGEETTTLMRALIDKMSDMQGAMETTMRQVAVLSADMERRRARTDHHAFRRILQHDLQVSEVPGDEEDDVEVKAIPSLQQMYTGPTPVTPPTVPALGAFGQAARTAQEALHTPAPERALNAQAATTSPLTAIGHAHSIDQSLVSKPTKFDGVARGEVAVPVLLKAWMMAIELLLISTLGAAVEVRDVDDPKLLATVISRLEGQAILAVCSAWSDARAGGSHFTVGAVFDVLTERYGFQLSTVELTTKLRRVRQVSNVEAYNTAFEDGLRELVERDAITRASAIDIYVTGLHAGIASEVRLFMATDPEKYDKGDPISAVRRVFSLARATENNPRHPVVAQVAPRQQQRQALQARVMHTTGVDDIPKDVKRFRRDHGLCWNCGEGGHFAAACGNPTSLEMPRGARGGGGSARATVMDTTTKASATPAASSAQASGKGESQ